MTHWLPILLLALPATAWAEQDHQHHGHHQMSIDSGGLVMNENVDRLPRGCESISRDHYFTIHAGQVYAQEPGMIFGIE